MHGYGQLLRKTSERKLASLFCYIPAIESLQIGRQDEFLHQTLFFYFGSLWAQSYILNFELFRGAENSWMWGASVRCMAWDNIMVFISTSSMIHSANAFDDNTYVFSDVGRYLFYH